VHEKGTTSGEASAPLAKEPGQAVGLKTPTLPREEDSLLNSLKSGVVLLGGDGRIKRHNRAIVRLLELAEGNLHGQTIEDAGLLARLPELASYLERSNAGADNFRARVGAGEEDRLVEITLKPIVDDAGEAIGTLLQCEDASVQEQFENTVKALQSTSNDLEVANEELQVTNEELEATNDELQSTNEELATTNEELQSLNEELQTTNLELADRTKEMDQLNRVYTQTLERIGLPVIVMNQNGRIDFYNRTAARLLKLRSGQHALGVEKLRLPASFRERLTRKCSEALSQRRSIVLSKVAMDRDHSEFDIRFNVFTQESGAASVLITFEPYEQSSNRPKRRRPARKSTAGRKSKKT